MDQQPFLASEHLKDVRYEIRGPLARRAYEMEKQGAEIIKLNIGNPGAFGFRMPEAMRKAIVENLVEADAYSHQKGIYPARAAIAMKYESIIGAEVSPENVYIGNGASELIMFAMRALINTGDEVLIPSPDYPLWTASVTIHGGKAVHYPCRREKGFVPDPAEVEALITPKTRAIVIISPNNPTGAVYPKAVLERLVAIAEERGLAVFSDEIYDQITYDGAVHTPVATLCKNTLCGTFGGLSKVYRACGIRVGWVVFTGDLDGAQGYFDGMDLISSLRLCSNVPGQNAVQVALGGNQSIQRLIEPGGRLYEARAAILQHVAKSRYLDVVAPMGAMYAFVRVKKDRIPNFDDQEFALRLLERKHLLIAPGRSFNVEYKDHFRITLLPPVELFPEIFKRIEDLLGEYESQARRASVHG